MLPFSASQTPFIATCSADGSAKMFDLKDVYLCQDTLPNLRRTTEDIVSIVPGTNIIVVLTVDKK